MRRKSHREVLLIVLVSLSCLVPMANGAPDPAHELDNVQERAQCEQKVAERIADNILFPQLTPQHTPCMTIKGSCTVYEDVDVGTRITSWNLIIYNQWRIDRTTDVKTVVECSGTYEMDVIHYGAAGVRFAKSVFERRPDVIVNGNNLDEFDLGNSLDQETVCNYHGPLSYCETYHSDGWRSSAVYPGKVIQLGSTVSLCGYYRIGNMDAATYLQDPVHHAANMQTGGAIQVCDTVKIANDDAVSE